MELLMLRREGEEMKSVARAYELKSYLTSLALDFSLETVKGKRVCGVGGCRGGILTYTTTSLKNRNSSQINKEGKQEQGERSNEDIGLLMNSTT